MYDTQELFTLSTAIYARNFPSNLVFFSPSLYKRTSKRLAKSRFVLRSRKRYNLIDKINPRVRVSYSKDNKEPLQAEKENKNNNTQNESHT